MIPSVLPSSSTPCRRSHPPVFIRELPKGMERIRERRRPIASSATPLALAPSARRTAIPRRLHASRSMESTPVPFLLMAFRSRASRSTFSEIFSTPATHPTQPGTSRSNSSSSGDLPGVHVQKLVPGLPQLVERRVPVPCQGPRGDEDFRHSLQPFVDTMSTFPARLKTRTGKPSFSMSP